MKSVIVAFSAFLFFLAIPASALTMSEAETLISLLKLNTEQTKLIRSYAGVSVKVVDATVTGTLLSTEKDKAGTFGVFRSNNDADFNWSMVLDAKNDVKIDRISVVHDVRKEVWSTGISKFLSFNGKKYQVEDLYPLVVFDKKVKERYVSAYDEEFELPKGKHELRLFGQKQGSSFVGATLIVEFADGTETHTHIQAN